MVSANFVIPYPPGFPILVPGQVVTRETIDFMRKLDVKEIHGYEAARGLKLIRSTAKAARLAASWPKTTPWSAPPRKGRPYSPRTPRSGPPACPTGLLPRAPGRRLASRREMGREPPCREGGGSRRRRAPSCSASVMEEPAPCGRILHGNGGRIPRAVTVART